MTNSLTVCRKVQERQKPVTKPWLSPAKRNYKMLCNYGLLAGCVFSQTLLSDSCKNPHILISKHSIKLSSPRREKQSGGSLISGLWRSTIDYEQSLFLLRIVKHREYTSEGENRLPSENITRLYMCSEPNITTSRTKRNAHTCESADCLNVKLWAPK